MTRAEEVIINLKKMARDNFYFLRRRVDKGNGKKTLGWICRRDDTEKTLESIDFHKLKTNINKLKENENENNKVIGRIQ